MKYNLFFLHGFLGHSHHFFKSKNIFKTCSDISSIYCPDLLSPTTESHLSPKMGFADWALNFNQWVAERSLGEERNVLIGYSQGGRLGVHAFMQNKKLWHKCFFLSSNPGLIPENEILTRRQWESNWAQILRNEPWEEFLKQWNQQSVFIGSEPNSEQESQFDKELLQAALVNWSLTCHDINLKELSNDKLCWLVGQRDDKYIKIFQKLSSLYGVQNIHYVEGGHRLLAADFENYILKSLALN